MWSIATGKIDYDPNPGAAASPTVMIPTRWFWSEELSAWTRNVAKRTYYRTKKEAESAIVLVAGMFPNLLGQMVILAASDIAIENAMAQKRDW